MSTFALVTTSALACTITLLAAAWAYLSYSRLKQELQEAKRTDGVGSADVERLKKEEEELAARLAKTRTEFAECAFRLKALKAEIAKSESQLPKKGQKS